MRTARTERNTLPYPRMEDFTDAEPTRWDARLGAELVCVDICGGGFGQPYLVVTVGASGRHASIELGLIEADDYKQDGNDPLHVTGWRWRHAGEELLSAGWSDRVYDSASNALAAARDRNE